MDDIKDVILEGLKADVLREEYLHRKVCISFIGGPGFGKTTVSRLLCQRMRLFHCSNDYIARQLGRKGVDISDYERKTALVSEIAFPFQDYLFSSGVGFVLDANLMLYLDVLKRRCDSYGYKLFIIELILPAEEALKRSLKRLGGGDAGWSNSDKADFELFLRQYTEYQARRNRVKPFAKINMERDVEEQVEKLFDEILIV